MYCQTCCSSDSAVSFETDEQSNELKVMNPAKLKRYADHLFLSL